MIAATADDVIGSTSNTPDENRSSDEDASSDASDTSDTSGASDSSETAYHHVPVEGTEKTVFCQSMERMLHGHPIRSSVLHRNQNAFTNYVLEAICNYNHRYDTRYILFGGWLRRYVSQYFALQPKIALARQTDTNISEQAISLLGGRFPVVPIEWKQSDFISGGDIDILYEDTDKLPKLLETLQSGPLTIAVKPPSRYTNPALLVTKVSVSTRDILSGFTATIQIDFVRILDERFFFLDFDVNALAWEITTPNMNLSELRVLDRAGVQVWNLPFSDYVDCLFVFSVGHTGSQHE